MEKQKLEMTKAPKQFHRQHRLAQAKREVFENWFLIKKKKCKVWRDMGVIMKGDNGMWLCHREWESGFELTGFSN